MFVNLTNSANEKITINTDHIKYVQEHTLALTLVNVGKDIWEIRGSYDDIVFLINHGCSKEAYARQTELW